MHSGSATGGGGGWAQYDRSVDTSNEVVATDAGASAVILACCDVAAVHRSSTRPPSARQNRPPQEAAVPKVRVTFKLRDDTRIRLEATSTSLQSGNACVNDDWSPDLFRL
jgi:hypothetical protein